jgi:hypothetical protein
MLINQLFEKTRSMDFFTFINIINIIYHIINIYMHTSCIKSLSLKETIRNRCEELSCSMHFFLLRLLMKNIVR